MFAFRFSSVLLLALSLAAEVLGSPTTSTCRNPIKRKEWRALSRGEKKNYLKAVQCLGRKPAKFNADIPGATSRFDEFQGVHIQQTERIHFVGAFAIWHRYYLMEFERALRTECGWKAGIPYWDWTIDAESDIPMEEWSIFNSDDGFGGNGPYMDLPANSTLFPVPGRTGGGCVPDGPFTADKFLVGLGPSHNASIANPHCLKRDFSPEVVKYNLQKATWNEVLEQSNFGRFAKRLEAEPNWTTTNIHGGGHFGIGGSMGDMGDSYNSPGDPLFYQHHANLDRLFWDWQKISLPARLKDVSGPIYMFDYANAVGGNITLDFEINLGPLGKTKKLKELMDIRQKDICYTYV